MRAQCLLLGRAICPKAGRPPSRLVKAESWIGSASSSRPEPTTLRLANALCRFVELAEPV